MPTKRRVLLVVLVVVAAFLGLAVLSALLTPAPAPDYTRAGSIPPDAVKVTPATDAFPPILNSTEFEPPIPMPGPVNTAGGEDSPFISPDGNTFYFFFTPDVSVPASQQLTDHVTGIWWTHRSNGTWAEPTRIQLSTDLALDGCPFVQGTTMWFCSARAGNYRGVDLYTAQLVNGAWTDVQNAGAQLNQVYQAGEMALSPDGQTMYWGTSSSAGAPNVMYQSNKTATGWDLPFRLANVNNVSGAFLPFVTPDGSALWFTAPSLRGYPGPAVFRSLRQGNGWGTPVEILSQFAAEPTLDAQGNLYFVHHFFRNVGGNMTMIEADIYVAYAKSTTAAAPANPTMPMQAAGLAGDLVASTAPLGRFS